MLSYACISHNDNNGDVTRCQMYYCVFTFWYIVYTILTDVSVFAYN